jgi:hypothetical protein
LTHAGVQPKRSPTVADPCRCGRVAMGSRKSMSILASRLACDE